MNRRMFLRATLAPLLTAVADSQQGSVPGDTKKRNILLIIADDVGVDQIPRYVDYYKSTSHPITVSDTATNPFTRMDTVEKLGQAGVTFLNAWSSPVCSPTRACLYTGNHCFRHGVYRPLRAVLPETIQGADTATIAKVLHNAGYANALFGKWHLGGADVCAPRSSSPLRRGPVHFGWDRFRGAMGGDLDHYTNWNRTVEDASGSTCASEATYATTVTAKDALDWIQQQADPWMATVAFNSPHSPWESPSPSDYGLRTSTSKQSYYRSMLEHLDISVRDLLAGISPDVLANTTIIFMGDNGTPAYEGGRAISDHFDAAHSKDTVYEGGIKVPLIIADGYAYLNPGSQEPGSGRIVSPGRFEAALTQTLDIFATCAEIGNADVSTGHDSVSLVPYLGSATPSPQREFIFAEYRPDRYDGSCSWDVAVAANRNGKTIKLILRDYNQATNDSNSCSALKYELYDLSNDPWEEYDLSSTGLVEDKDALKDQVLPSVFAGVR